MVGPIAIDQGRARYNNIIQSTAKEQTFANIVRVYHHEPTAFMDVTEVDATTTLAGSANGVLTNIGARAGTSGGTLVGQTGSVTGGVTYSETPLIRYQPLLGQALVAQLVTPVSADALGWLFDSSWKTPPLLDLSTSFITVDGDEFYAALNIISVLENKQAIELVSGKSVLTKTKDSTSNGNANKPSRGPILLEVTNKSAGTGPNDSLVLYLLPYHPHAPRHASLDERRRRDTLWRHLLEIYKGSQPPDPKCPLNKCLRRSIELRTSSVARENMNNGLLSAAPVMRTYSGLGILKNATEQPWPRIGFVDRETYARIRGYPWNDFKADKDLSFFTLKPRDEASGDEKDVNNPTCESDLITRHVCNWIDTRGRGRDDSYIYIYEPGLPVNDEFVEGNKRLGHLRRYLLIIMSDEPPLDAYVSWYDHGHWYWIAPDDEISQKNFDLISLFMTMMAVPPTSGPLSPTISVGGG